MANPHNRWLPNGFNASASGGSSGVQRAMLVVAILALLPTAASALWLGRPFLAAILMAPEHQEKTDENFARLQEDMRQLKESRADIQRRLTDLQGEIERNEATKEHQRALDAMTAEYTRLQIVVQDQQHKITELERKLERAGGASSSKNRARPAGSREATTPTVSVREHSHYEYVVTMRDGWVESDRRYYRDRFSKGCTVPSSTIVDTPRGFIIRSGGCHASAFAGFEVVEAPGSGVKSRPGIRPLIE